MNCIELNGVKSTTVKGLLIQSLPPISKPLIRTEIEEIDGRDGDVVTKLGYAAYDKAFSIGLYGNYDIDDVIRFFDSSGTVIFSNEPDKYYHYQILEQIDFERLVRFRVATVTMHVQPFKYSAVEKAVTYTQKITVKDFTQTKNGAKLETVHDDIVITGTPTAATEFYVPIESLTLSAGKYIMTANASGTNVNKCSVRLIGSAPSNADSFGQTYIQLDSTTGKALSATLTESKTYNYLWFYVTTGAAISAIATIGILGTGQRSMNVVNHGNTASRPRITVYGEGAINLSLNGNQIFAINLGVMGYITIDTTKMNAYHGRTLMNRYVTGDYDKFALNAGKNVIAWTGGLTEIDVENYSRWI